MHFSILSNHLHLIVEAAHRRTLSKGMRLMVRATRTLGSCMLHRSGTVFAQRWFDGYRDRQADGKSPLPRARTFLLCTGWRRGRGGRFSVDDVPGRCRAP